MPCSGFNAGGIEFDAVDSGDFCDLVRASAGNYDAEIRDSCSEMKCSDHVTSPLTMQVVECHKPSLLCPSSPEEEMEDSSEEAEVEEEVDSSEEELFFHPPRRISMLWNSKLKWKEERKKVLKVSIAKLRKIEDPELSLCRAILINNTVKRLHREIRDEKMARYPDVVRPVPQPYHLPGPLPPPQDPFPRKRPSPFDYADPTTAYNNDKENADYHHLASPTSPVTLVTVGGDAAPAAKKARVTNDFSRDVTMLDEYRHELRTVTASPSPLSCQSPAFPFNAALDLNGETRSNAVTLKSDAVTQRNHLVSLECCTKDEMNTFNRYQTGVTTSAVTTTTTTTASTMNHHAVCVTSTAATASSVTAAVTQKQADKMASEYEKQYSQYSCGQFSIFGELQSVVFHSLITSLES